MLVIKKPFDDEMLRTATESGGLLTIEYGCGFIATCILLLVGAAICGYHYNEEKKKAGAQENPTRARERRCVRLGHPGPTTVKGAHNVLSEMRSADTGQRDRVFELRHGDRSTQPGRRRG